MVATAHNPVTSNRNSELLPQKPGLKLIETNYRTNTSSDYTEKIQELDKDFKYSDNSNYYWNNPEFSLFYGTPLYEEASPSQKIALNHLYWYMMYHFTATSEYQTIVYNLITAGVFAKIKGYENVAQTLQLESDQEVHHIHAFRKICYQMLKTLLGKEAFKESLHSKMYHGKKYQDLLKKISEYNYRLARFLASNMIKESNQNHSEYLKELEDTDRLPVFSVGFMGEGFASRELLQFLGVHWGRSPFLGCHYYTLRFMANMGLKHTEHSNYKYFRKLEKEGAFIPAPTAISYYHFLDESFHVSTSRVMARELYRGFPKPTAYEKLLANVAFYRVQAKIWGGLSAIMPDKHRADSYSLMTFAYKVLQSPLFSMSGEEALNWLEKCLCREHNGLHLNAKFHQSLLSGFRQTYNTIDYLWPVNREMRLMEAGGSISHALKNNIKTFQQFSKLVSL